MIKSEIQLCQPIADDGEDVGWPVWLTVTWEGPDDKVEEQESNAVAPTPEPIGALS